MQRHWQECRPTLLRSDPAHVPVWDALWSHPYRTVGARTTERPDRPENWCCLYRVDCVPGTSTPLHQRHGAPDDVDLITAFYIPQRCGLRRVILQHHSTSFPLAFWEAESDDEKPVFSLDIILNEARRMPPLSLAEGVVPHVCADEIQREGLGYRRYALIKPAINLRGSDYALLSLRVEICPKVDISLATYPILVEGWYVAPSTGDRLRFKPMNRPESWWYAGRWGGAEIDNLILQRSGFLSRHLCLGEGRMENYRTHPEVVSQIERYGRWLSRRPPPSFFGATAVTARHAATLARVPPALAEPGLATGTIRD